ncbi:DUF554 domain-containing protein [Massilimicrobiota timonensis]|uniref:DUF554 domain-containing protein n=1 Tax=Massilimicrobiota timonensis TaxID=1776392 RepID=UPI001EF72FA3|nr:DUF554 domain-containing protein [Massilimicrobiota timonensis]
MMRGMGTIANVLAIIIGGSLGLFCKNLLKARYQETIMKATGIATMFLALSGTLSKMFVIQQVGIQTTGSMNVILSLVIGALIGEMIDIDHFFEKFGNWLKMKTKSQGDHQFVNAFVTASLTVCIGAMAIMGAIQDGIYANPSILFAKAVLDFVIILVMSSSMGKGCFFAFIPVAFLQGTLTALSVGLAPFMTTSLLNHLDMVGNILIFCVGINLIWPRTIRVANLLPALVVAVVLSFL